MHRLNWAAIVTFALAACRNGAVPGPPPVLPPSQLHMVLESRAAKPLFAKQVSFWATLGEERVGRLFYQGATPADTGPVLLEFQVPPGSLFKRPDGTPLQLGDSVRITVTVVDTTRFLFDFQPVGLQFNPSAPAQLKVELANADHDFDGDGVIDARDAAIEADSLDLWRRDPPDTLWYREFATRFTLLEQLDVSVLSFSQYAAAW